MLKFTHPVQKPCIVYLCAFADPVCLGEHITSTGLSLMETFLLVLLMLLDAAVLLLMLPFSRPLRLEVDERPVK